jgi:PadR family transcriptional regulator, regulatory protein PadR
VVGPDTLTFYTSQVYCYTSEVDAYMSLPKSDLPQGTLDLLILKVLTLEPLHGYAIAQRLQQISREVVQVPQGSLYPALHRLENKRLLVAEWKISDTGRDAKFYRLTKTGRAFMKAETASWRRLADAVGLILDAAEGEAS